MLTYCLVQISGSTIPSQSYSAADAEFLCEVAGQVALAAANMKAYE